MFILLYGNTLRIINLKLFCPRSRIPFMLCLWHSTPSISPLLFYTSINLQRQYFTITETCFSFWTEHCCHGYLYSPCIWSIQCTYLHKCIIFCIFISQWGLDVPNSPGSCSGFPLNSDVWMIQKVCSNMYSTHVLKYFSYLLACKFQISHHGHL